MAKQNTNIVRCKEIIVASCGMGVPASKRPLLKAKY